MRINEYKELAMRTLNPKLDKKDVLINGVMGLCGEAGEVIDIVKKHLAQGHDLDVNKIEEELGDVCWYIAEVAHALDLDLEQVFVKNIVKLKQRYPEGFSNERSINRNNVFLVEMDLKIIEELFLAYDQNLKVISFNEVLLGQKNNDYLVETNETKYVLRIYHQGNYEINLYHYLNEHINVPKLVYSDNSKKIYPFEYAIYEYKEGQTLEEYIKEKKKYEVWIIKQIVDILLALSYERYPENGYIDRQLRIETTYPEVKVQLKRLLEKENVRKRIDENILDYLSVVTNQNIAIFEEIEGYHNLSLGASLFKNLWVDEEEKVWLVNLEDICVSNWLNDISLFINYKNDNNEKLLTLDVLDYFYYTYNELALKPLGKHWKLSCKVIYMLRLFYILDINKISKKTLGFIRKEINDIVADMKEYLKMDIEVREIK